MNNKKRNAIICGVLSAILMIIITLISTNMFKEVKIKKSDFIKATKECPYSYEDNVLKLQLVKLDMNVKLVLLQGTLV